MKKSVVAVMRLTEITDRLKAIDKIETRSAGEDTEFKASLEAEQTKSSTRNTARRQRRRRRRRKKQRLHPRDFTSDTRGPREAGSEKQVAVWAVSERGTAGTSALRRGRSRVPGQPRHYRRLYRWTFSRKASPRQLAEIRADAATTAPAAASASQSVAWAPHIFADSIAQREFNVSMPAAQSGAWIEPGFSCCALTASAKAKGVKQDSTAATVVGLTAKPARIATRQTIQLEDIYSIGSDAFEEALKQQARAALSDELDNQLINGDGVSPNLTGLIKELGNPAGTPSSIATFEDLIEGIGAAIDGKWSYSLRDLRVLVHPDVFKLALGEI